MRKEGEIKLNENILASILICGDTHLSSRNRGGHKDYPEESLYYYNSLTDLALEYNCTHCIDLGDFTYGKFHTLEYRTQVENALQRRKEAVNGNYYMLRGNHDVSTSGLTEYGFYLNKYYSGSCNLEIGNLNLMMVDNGDEDKDLDIKAGKTNIVLAHNYFAFEDSNLPFYGQAIKLENHSKWYGVNNIISGHIHMEHIQKGRINKLDENTGDTYCFDCICHNLPCLCRTDYSENLPDKGAVVILEVYEDRVQYNRVELDLLPIEDCFKIEEILAERKEKESKPVVEIRDIIEALSRFEMVAVSPELKINSLNVDERYKKKALELYKGE